MQKKNGFTLVEVLAVIVILGIVMIIAVPAISKYILKSDKSVYASDVQAYIESIRAKYEMKEYGPLLKDDEIMMVPLSHIVFEKGDSQNSPYGAYDFSRSYVLIVPEKHGYNFYATVIDSAKVGIINQPANVIGENVVQDDIEQTLPLISTYRLINSTYEFNEKTYKRSDLRDIEGLNETTEEKVIVFKLT